MSEPIRCRLAADHLTLAYERLEVAHDLSLEIPHGKITCIVGANACGKSTLLHALARLLKPNAGAVLLDGKSIHRLPTKEVATRLGLLPQSPTAPEGITVADLVSRGRYPHQKWFRQWSATDEAVITDAMRATGTMSLADRPVDELSGGQRQRVWMAMTLAQGTELMLLDEPTTYLDLAHQVEILDLLVDLNQRDHRTIVLVLHDLNQAARYSHHLVAMRSGSIVATGPPSNVITEELVQDVFGLRCRVVTDQVAGTPHVLPIGRHAIGTKSPDQSTPLRAIYNEPHPVILDKAIDHVDEGARSFIDASPLVIVASSDGTASDASPRGGPPGFVKVIDPHRIAFADLNGNNRLDSFSNVLTNPAVGLLFMVPGMRETLRLNGNATLSQDQDLRTACAIEGRVPKVVMLVEVAECYLHCGAALRRAAIWDRSTWLNRKDQPSPGAIVAAHAGLDVSAQTIESDLAAYYNAQAWTVGGKPDDS